MNGIHYFTDEYPNSITQDQFAGVVDGSISSKETLLTEMADQLGFPEYFGHNWSALNDCLCDFWWLKQKRIAIVHLSTMNLANDVLDMYLSIVVDAISQLRETQTRALECWFPLQEKQRIESALSASVVRGATLDKRPPRVLTRPTHAPVGTLIREALTDADISRCFDVMAELRPHVPREGFVERIRRQMTSEGGNYRLAFAEDSAGEVVCVAGYRYAENLVYGRNMYVDDLVSSSRARSAGFGGAMLAWLEAQARAHGCIHLHLDSGVTRHAAHRFYLRERYDITGHHFVKKL